jgi:hypothetical protein
MPEHIVRAYNLPRGRTVDRAEAAVVAVVAAAAAEAAARAVAVEGSMATRRRGLRRIWRSHLYD